MATDAPAPTRKASMQGRILGVDLARALAILGMLAVHIGPTDLPGLPARLYASPHGRASLLFVLVAGVGVSLLVASRTTSVSEARWKLAWRATLLLPLGLALQELDHGANVILQDYALLFVLAILVVRLPDRWLMTMAAVSATLGPVAFLWGRGTAPATFDRTSTALSDPAGEILHGLVLSGPYPLITWLAPFAFGIWLGRRDLRSLRVRARLAVGGTATALGALVAARLLVGTLGPPTAAGDPLHLATSAAHGQMPLWLIGGTGAAAAVLGVSLIVADLAPRTSWPLVATGQLALTVYVAHLLALHAAPALLTSDRLVEAAVLLAAFAVVLATGATAWRATFDRGPLELALHAPWLVPPRPRTARVPMARPGGDDGIRSPTPPRR